MFEHSYYCLIILKDTLETNFNVNKDISNKKPSNSTSMPVDCLSGKAYGRFVTKYWKTFLLRQDIKLILSIRIYKFTIINEQMSKSKS